MADTQPSRKGEHIASTTCTFLDEAVYEWVQAPNQVHHCSRQQAGPVSITLRPSSLVSHHFQLDLQLTLLKPICDIRCISSMASMLLEDAHTGCCSSTCAHTKPSFVTHFCFHFTQARQIVTNVLLPHDSPTWSRSPSNY